MTKRSPDLNRHHHHHHSFYFRQHGSYHNIHTRCTYKSSAVAEMGDRLATIDMGAAMGATDYTDADKTTVWPWPRPISLPSSILIHPTVWPQYTNVTSKLTDRQIDRQTGQRSDSIGRTVLQTVAQKSQGMHKNHGQWWPMMTIQWWPSFFSCFNDDDRRKNLIPMYCFSSRWCLHSAVTEIKPQTSWRLRLLKDSFISDCQTVRVSMADGWVCGFGFGFRTPHVIWKSETFSELRIHRVKWRHISVVAMRSPFCRSTRRTVCS